MKLGSMQQYMGPDQLKESFIPKRNHQVKVMPGDSLSCTKKKHRKHKRTIVMLIEI